jgi:precorrin-3B C17-methyltransferase
VGIGPGGAGDRTRRAEQAIAQSQVVIGYTRYMRLIEDITAGKETISTGMTQEIERCRIALQRALAGATVALVSSGDPGVYGMAGLALELSRDCDPVPVVEIVPGVTAAHAAAAVMGAPLMLDYAVISLSDLLVPWDIIARRLEAVAGADLVTVLYNPRSKNRVHQLEDAISIFSRHRASETTAGIGTALGTEEENIVITDLGNILSHPVDMRSVVLIGNSSSRRINNWFLTPRGYSL